MHIALVSREYPPETPGGGIGTYTRALARNLVALGHRVSVISETASRKRRYEDEGVHVYRIAPFGSSLLGPYRALSSLRHSIGVFVCLREIHRGHPIDVVELPDYEGEGMVTTLRGTFPTLVRCHSTWGLVLHAQPVVENVMMKRQLRLLCALEQYTLRHADLILAISASIKGIYSSMYDLSPETIEVQHNGLSAPDIFLQGNGNAGQEPRRASGDGVVFLHAGRQEWRKGTDVVVRAFAQANVPNKRLILVGEDTTTAPNGGSMRTYCRALAEESGVAEQVQIVDRVPQEDLLAYYRGSDVFVAPSRYEPFGLVYLEAMATGLPVIGSTAGGAPEIIMPSCGRVVPPEDVASLALAMEELGTNEALLRAMGQACRERVRREYTPSQHAVRMLHWYQKAINRHKTRRHRSTLHRLVRP